MAAVEALRGGPGGPRVDEAEPGRSGGGGAPKGGGATAVPDVGIIGRRLPGNVVCVNDRSLETVHRVIRERWAGSLS